MKENLTYGEVTAYYEEIVEFNSLKVLEAFRSAKIDTSCFAGTTGYGYNDYGREKLIEVYKRIFKGEDGLVSSHLLSGTHSLYLMYKSILKKGDVLLSLTGDIYDTLNNALNHPQGIGSNGVEIRTLDPFETIDNNDYVNLETIKNYDFTQITHVTIQRSIGYNNRPSIKISTMEKIIEIVRQQKENIVIFVDNCYGEFVDKKEPLEIGADLICGSLIKNPGGSLSEKGGYILGRKDLIELISYEFTAPGIGLEIGAENGREIRLMFQGIYMAPLIVGETLKSMIYGCYELAKRGFETKPNFNEKRGDIVQRIILNNEEQVIKFVQTIQKYSPIDSYVVPQKDYMAGYLDEIIMASGSFISGSSIELSCDAPIRKPYIAYMQGGTNFYNSKYAIDCAIKEMLK